MNKLIDCYDDGTVSYPSETKNNEATIDNADKEASFSLYARRHSNSSNPEKKLQLRIPSNSAVFSNAANTALANFLLEVVCQLLAPNQRTYRHLRDLLSTEFQRYGFLQHFHTPPAMPIHLQESASNLNQIFHQLILQEVGATKLRLPEYGLYAQGKLKAISNGKQEFEKPFVFIKEIGRGGYGKVMKVKSLHDSQFYAIKEIFLDSDSVDEERDLREVRNLAQLDHSNIVRYFSCWIDTEIARKVTIENCMGNGDEVFNPSGNTNSEVASAHLPSQAEVSTTSSDSLSTSSSSDSPITATAGHLSNSSNIYSNCSENSLIVFQKSNNSSKTVKHLSWSDTEDSAPLEKRKAKWKGKRIRQMSERAVVRKLCIQMQYCQDTLSHWLRRRNNCDDVKVDDSVNRSIVRQLLSGVKYLHDNGLIHRDLKPANIFLQDLSKSNSEMWQVRIGDFGLSRRLAPMPNILRRQCSGAHSGDSDEEKLTGQQGTSLYMSPEMERGFDYGKETDIFSLGVVLYELYHPFITESERIHCLQDFRKNGKVEPCVGDKWCIECDVMENMVAKKPEVRPSVSDLLSRESDSSQIWLEKSDRVAQLLRDSRSRDLRIKELELENESLKTKLREMSSNGDH